MSNYLNNLVARTLRQGPIIEPRVGSLFEPVPFAPGNMVAPEKKGDGFASTRRSLDASEPDTLTSQVSDSHVRPATHPTPKDTSSTVGTDNETHINRLSFEARTYHPTVTSPTLRRSEDDGPMPMLLERSSILLDRLKVRAREPRLAEEDRSPVNAMESDGLSNASGRESKGSEVDGFNNNPRSVLASNDGNRIQPAIATGERASLTTIASPRAEPLAALRGEIHGPSVINEVPPTITVTIGRVDVRAVFSPPPPPQRASSNRTRAAMSLGEYLKQRNEGRR